MKSLRMFALFALLLVAVGSSLGQLPASQGVKADVPFAFSAGDQMFPAGEYTVINAGSSGVLTIRQTGGSGKMTVSHAAARSGPADKTKLVFHRYGYRYMLSQIWVAGNSQGVQLPRTKLEKELAARSRYESSEVIARK
jgi:hypothetical protein